MFGVEINDGVPVQLAYDQHIAHIRTKVSSKNNGRIADLFRALAESKVNLDMVMIEPGEIRFTAAANMLSKTCQIVNTLGYQAEFAPQCAKVHIQGGRPADRSVIVASATKVLSRANIPILQIAESCGTLAILVKENHLSFALTALSRELTDNPSFKREG